jgi:hypothetical protein
MLKCPQTPSIKNAYLPKEMQNPCGIGFLEKEFKGKRWVLPSKAFHGAVVVGLGRP